MPSPFCFRRAIFLLFAIVTVACGEESAHIVTEDTDSHLPASTETGDDTGQDSDSQTASDTGTDSQTDVSGDTATDIATDSDSASEVETDTDTHTDTDTDTQTETQTDTDTGTDDANDTESTMDTESETAMDTASDTGMDSDTGSDTETDTASDTTLIDPYWTVGPIERTVVVNGVNISGYVLEFTNGSETWKFECIAQQGGLISAFSLNGTSIIHNSNASGAMYGSTFWTSPQSVWNWPPPAELDTATWTVFLDPQGRFIEMTSPVISSLQLQVTKRFEADLTSGVVRLAYTVRNTGGAARSVAPWEITRVSPGGLTYYPTGQGSITSGGFSAMPYSQSSGVTWIDHQQVTGEHKLFADGAEGWLAHTDGDLLLLKLFDDITPSQAAPGEAEIELYAKTTYEEVEQQGAYVTLAPATALTFNVTWSLREVPQGVSTAAGSLDLLDYTRTMVD